MGILRDKTRSLFPFLVVTVGVALVIVLMGFMEGIMMDMIDMTAKLDTGHLRFVNKPFLDEEYLNPMDRALAARQETLAWLTKNANPQIQWSPRIRWSAILDAPDEKGETSAQTPAMGMAVDLLSPRTLEVERLNLAKSVVEGRLPRQSKEMLAGYELAETLHLKLGSAITLIGQSFDGGMAADNYVVVGFIRFGIFAMDKKMALIDIGDAQETFYMEDMVTDWLGFLPASVGFSEYAGMESELESRLGGLRENPPAGWAKDDNPVVKTVLEQRGLGEFVGKFVVINNVVILIFVILMILVLWNAGLLNGIHRYGEMGLRLALGESHRKLLATLMLEAFFIGLLGSAAGSLLGGGLVYYLQEVGVDMGRNFAQTGLMFNDVIRARMSVGAFIQGVVPGITAGVLGSFFASLAIFKRSEANLFRELEM